MEVNTIIIGDCIEVMRDMPDGCVDMCVCSPPYWGLRDYGTGTWEGGDPECDHLGKPVPTRAGFNERYFGRESSEDNKQDALREPFKEVCGKCGAKRIDRQIGLEESPEAYVAKMVEVFREVRRVLADHGVCFVNLGDSYANDTKWGGKSGNKNYTSAAGGYAGQRKKRATGLKPKDLVGIPWRVALALQADGWWLRQDIVWNKPNPMPESVTDRCTKAHEYLFLLTKKPRYFWDAEAIKEENTTAPHAPGWATSMGDRNDRQVDNEANTRIWGVGGRNRRSVWTIRDDGLATWFQWYAQQPEAQILYDRYAAQMDNASDLWTIPTEPCPEAHFATYPKELVRPCILAGTSAKGYCPQCGKPWVRVVEKQATGKTQKMPDGFATHPGDHGSIHKDGREKGEQGKPVMENVTTGWRPTCKCYGRWYAYRYKDPATGRWRSEPYWRSGKHPPLRPGIVLDPFGGSGTTGVVAAQEKRDYVLIELSEDYANNIARPRLASVELNVPVSEQRAGQMALFE